MKNPKVLVVFLFLIGISAFSIFKYLGSLKEKYDLLNTVNKIKEQVSSLETEKQNLLQTLEKEKQLQQQLGEENLQLKESLKASEEKLTQLNSEFAQAKEAVERLNSEITALKAENSDLKEERDSLQIQLIRAVKEKDSVKARLGSLFELKKAIKEVKKQMHKVGIQIKQIAKAKEIEGNRGFLIKDGKSTLTTKVKIEVIPSP